MRHSRRRRPIGFDRQKKMTTWTSISYPPTTDSLAASVSVCAPCKSVCQRLGSTPMEHGNFVLIIREEEGKTTFALAHLLRHGAISRPKFFKNCLLFDSRFFGNVHVISPPILSPPFCYVPPPSTTRTYTKSRHLNWCDIVVLARSFVGVNGIKPNKTKKEKKNRVTRNWPEASPTKRTGIVLFHLYTPKRKRYVYIH